MRKSIYGVIWLTILVVILLSLSIWGIFYIDDTSSKISIFGIVAVVVAAFTSVLTVNINNQKAHEREYNLMVLKEKQEVCEHFYTAYFEILESIKGDSKQKGKHQKIAFKEMMLFKKGLMNWGSEELIKEFLDYEKKSEEFSDDIKSLLFNGNKFIVALRKELGFEDSGKVNILSVILNGEVRKELEYE